MQAELQPFWVYLAASPLFNIALTLVAYQLGVWCQGCLKSWPAVQPLANPILIAVVAIAFSLHFGGIDYATYFEGAQFIHFMLGTATVALAVPLYHQARHLAANAVAVLVALCVGSTLAVVSAGGIVFMLGAPDAVTLSILPKSVTAPVAMAVSEQMGGLAALTAVLVILTGILGASIGTLLFNALGIKDWRARGLAMGTASHGIGTARALSIHPTAGAFAGLAMGLNALLTALLLPLFF